MTKTILVADDEYDLTRTLKALLERDGFEVETCADGRQVLDRLCGDSAKPDLLLLDVMMPILSGLEVLRELRDAGALEGLPVVLMGSVPPRVPREEYGWEAFLAKPFTLEALRTTVAKFLGQVDGGSRGPARNGRSDR